MRQKSHFAPESRKFFPMQWPEGEFLLRLLPPRGEKSMPSALVAGVQSGWVNTLSAHQTSKENRHELGSD
jgi:hypothetical protein